MHRRNVEVSLSYHVVVVTLEENMCYCSAHSLNIVVDLVDSTGMSG